MERARSTPDFVQVGQDTVRGPVKYLKEPVRRPRSSADIRPNFKAKNGLKLLDCRPNIDRMFADARAIYGRPVYEICDLIIRHWKIAELRAGFCTLRTSAGPKNCGGARSDRAHTGRLPGENALFSSQRSRAVTILDM